MAGISGFAAVTMAGFCESPRAELVPHRYAAHLLSRRVHWTGRVEATDLTLPARAIQSDRGMRVESPLLTSL